MSGRPADHAELYLRESGDPTLLGTSLDKPLPRDVRELLNLIDRARAADNLPELRAVVVDLLTNLCTQRIRTM